MPVSLNRTLRGASCAFALAGLAMSFGAVSGAKAESAYVAQMATGTAVPVQMVGRIAAPPAVPAIGPATAAPVYTPEMTAARGLGSQLAQTLQIGNANSVAHIQVGAANISTAAVIGQANNLSVLQAGSNLQSNVVLVGTQGLNVGVIQPQGSLPINMLIARLPNGGLLIKR